jgi:hypothetical protein
MELTSIYMIIQPSRNLLDWKVLVTQNLMSYKLNRYHRDHLYWIYPLIFIGLTIYAITEDKYDRESAGFRDSKVNTDSSLTVSVQTRMVDSLRVTGRIRRTKLLMDN